MNKVLYGLLNFILFLALVGGVAFCSPSIKGFASSTSSYSGQITRVFYSSTYSGVPTDGHTYKCKVNSSSWSMSFVGHSGETYSNLTGEVYLLTTSGSYLIGVAGGSSSSVTVANASSSRYYDGYPLKLFGILRGFVTSSSQPGVHSSGTLGLSCSVEDTTGTNEDLSSIKSDTTEILRLVQGLDFSSLYDLVADIWVYLDGNQRSQFANILSTLIDCDVQLESIDDSLTELLSYVQELKRSLCFDFPLTIDGNYQLSSIFLKYADFLNTNNNPLSLGSFAFDFNELSVNPVVTIIVPSSHKLLWVSSRSVNGNITFPDPSSFVTSLGTSFSISYTENSMPLYAYSMLFTIPDSIPTGSFISFSIYRNLTTSFSGRFALYDYVVGANDILNYMKDQWAQSAPAVSDLDSHTSITDGFGSSVGTIEDGYFTSFSSAVDGTGIRAFDWSVFGGMSIFTAFVTGFYNLLPAEYALYITAVLIVGCVAVLLSAIGRVVKKGGDNG